MTPRALVGLLLVSTLLSSAPAMLQVQELKLTPAGFLTAASQYNAAAFAQGGDRTIAFTTPEGQRYEGSLDRRVPPDVTVPPQAVR